MLNKHKGFQLNILIHFKSNIQSPETYMNPLHFHGGKTVLILAFVVVTSFFRLYFGTFLYSINIFAWQKSCQLFLKKRRKKQRFT